MHLVKLTLREISGDDDFEYVLALGQMRADAEKAFKTRECLRRCRDAGRYRCV
jgi:hypothetical protein